MDRSECARFGRALAQLGIEHIAADSPEARARSERAICAHQQRLPRELARAGTSTPEQANDYLEGVYRRRHNEQFARPAQQQGMAFEASLGGSLPDILCEHYERVVGDENCARFEGRCLQIPPTRPATTTSGKGYGCISTSTTAWLCSTAPGSRGARIPRDSFAVQRAPGCLSRPLQSGHFLCYRTGRLC
ncbi:MAG: hypothetical protein WCJ69_12130 [Betaproteobacteria bacterium]